MHNPLSILRAMVLDGLIQAGHMYFVRQSYPRGMFKNIKESLLITPYKSAGEANHHYNAIVSDPRRYIYSVYHPGDREKLYYAASQPEGYGIYIALLKDREWKPGHSFTAAIRRYMRLHGGSRPDGRENLSAELSIRFGELFINLKRHQQELKIPLSEIEKT
ncbi:hypothetical protein [Chitinophaga sp. YIM B06452]|uniref:hypothetical protein n=1 Tax=Chitinophaga sp. YIM B06452 TaxID=3082158 RepID=UPI0031FE8599